MKKSILGSLLILALIGCGGNDSKTSDPAPGTWIDFDKVARQYNPAIHETQFSIVDVEQIKLDVFSENRDFRIIYSNTIPAGQGLLKMYSVFGESAKWGRVEARSEAKILKLNSYGEYYCEIHTQNGNITYLKGGCYIRVDVVLPPGVEVEVFNRNNLISRRFFPMSVESLIETVDAAVWPADKFAAIESFFQSYQITGKKPTLLAGQLGTIVHDFSWKEEKFKVLRRMHSIVSDRQNLYKMIEDEFSYFDREEARRIVGIKTGP